MAITSNFRKSLTFLGLLLSPRKREEKRRREEFEKALYDEFMRLREGYKSIHQYDIEDIEFASKYQNKYLKKAIHQNEITLRSLLDWWEHFNRAERVENIIKEELQDFARKCALLPVPITDYDTMAGLFFDLFPHLPVAKDPDLGRFGSSKSHTIIAKLLAPHITPIPAPEFAPIRDKLPPIERPPQPEIRVPMKLSKPEDWGDIAEWVFVNGAYELPPRLQFRAPARYLNELPQRTREMLDYYQVLQGYCERLAAWKRAGGPKPVKPPAPADFREAERWGNADDWIYNNGQYRPICARDRKPYLEKDFANDMANVETLDNKIREQIPKDID